MSEEFKPRSRDVRLHHVGSDSWEDSRKRSEEAQVSIDYIGRLLKGHGVDLQKSSILEIGSGKGLLLNAMKNKGFNVVGVDARPRGIENERLVGARIEQLPFADGSFDVVVAEGVFDSDVYDQDHKRMFKEVARVLRSEGVFYGSGSISIDRDVNPDSYGLKSLEDSEDTLLYRKSS